MAQQGSEHDKIPVSVGKPSLRRRLEAYYRLCAPAQIAGPDWKERFDKVYEKYGGSVEGERKLAKHLAKKYGVAIELQIAAPPADDSAHLSSPLPMPALDIRSETWYELNGQERDSGVLNFLSAAFDPVAALQSPLELVLAANPWARDAVRLDRVDKCRSLLPPSDPLYRIIHAPSSSKRENSSELREKPKPLAAFASIADATRDGPYRVLYTALVQRQRVRVVIRYVNGVRGTITGMLVAYDKHFNLILRDATEVYQNRHANDGDSNETNVHRELARRTQQPPTAWFCKQRRLAQVLVRGDNIVSVYLAKTERSAWPVTAKTSLSAPPPRTRYRAISVRVPASASERVGTPGSVLHFVRESSHRIRKRDYSSR